MGITARVENGRILVDEPTDLPDGTVLELVVEDGGDELDDAERGRLHAALDAGGEELRRGEGIPADDVLRELEGAKGR